MKLNSKNKLRTWLILPVLIIFFWALPVFSFNLNPLSSAARADFFNKDLETFEEIFELVADKYVFPPDPKKLFSTAIEKMVRRADSLNATLTLNPSGSEVLFNNKKTRYFLNYDIGHDMDELRKIYYFLHDGSKNALPKKELETAAIRGLMSSLDTYSQYLDESAFKKSIRDTEGKYGGLGMVISMSDNRLLVVETMEDSPAREAGILSNDTFLKVNGKEINKMQIQALADLLRGYPETQVTLKMFRPSEEKEYTRTLTRKIILVNTVKYKPLDNHIGYIKVSSFSKLTEEQLQKHLEKAKKDRIKGFILDLRGNPGGLLNQSVKVASYFLFKGRMVVFTKGRSEKDYREYRSLYKNSLYDMPVIVLINQYSASAAEIVAGALRDSGNALLIGENSYGKGSVQTIFRIGNGTGVRLTTSKYYTPTGIDITKNGIVPEIKIIDDIKDGRIITENGRKKNNLGNKLELKASDLKRFFENDGVKLDNNRDATVEFSRRILKSSHIGNKKRSMEKAREIAANLDY